MMNYVQFNGLAGGTGSGAGIPLFHEFTSALTRNTKTFLQANIHLLGGDTFYDSDFQRTLENELCLNWLILFVVMEKSLNESCYFRWCLYYFAPLYIFH